MITNVNNYLLNTQLRTANIISSLSYNRTLNSNEINEINEINSEENLSDILLPTAIYVAIRGVYILFVLLYW
jgi:hypothetical protein